MFESSSIAVVGAAREEGKVGHVILKNLLGSRYSGKIFPVNPKASEILGLKCYPSIGSIEGDVELVVIVVPNVLVPQMLEEAGRKGVKGAIVISAGFKETGGDGSLLEERLREIAQRYDIRVLGPNCLGIINTQNNMNATVHQRLSKGGGGGHHLPVRCDLFGRPGLGLADQDRILQVRLGREQDGCGRGGPARISAR